jgi:4-oxalocrotonate tautomerase
MSIGWSTSQTTSTKDGEEMPHVIVKLWPGKSHAQKRRLADAITKDVMSVLHYGDESVSVAFEEVDAKDWAEKVYQPDIVGKADTLLKKPGYRM